jgi:hypothetical protein
MSNKTKTLANSVIAAIVISITLRVFLTVNAANARTAIDWYALVFVLISEAALFGGIIYTTTAKRQSNNMLIKLGIISTLFFYWIATIVISTFTRGIFANSVGGFVAIQMVLCAITAIIIIILYMSAVSIAAKDEKLMNSRLLMQNCENLTFSLKSNTAFSDYHELLNKLYDEIKYSDKTESVDGENIIYSQITELSNTLKNNNSDAATVQDVFKAVDAIILSIKERNISIRNLKQGGF